MHHKCSDLVGKTALKMYNIVAQNSSFSGRYPSMLAMTIVNLAAKECYEDIPSKVGLATVLVLTQRY